MQHFGVCRVDTRYWESAFRAFWGGGNTQLVPNPSASVSYTHLDVYKRQALVRLLQQRPLSQITVNDIVEECGVARQTFYYHFQDIYDLLQWIFLQAAAEMSVQMAEAKTWRAKLLLLFHSILDNKTLVNNVYNSIDDAYIYRFIHTIPYDALLERFGVDPPLSLIHI